MADPAIPFSMPSLGADMDAGTLVEWKVRPGDRVNRGQVVAVVAETRELARDAAELDDEILAFNSAIVITFAVLAAVLLLTTLFQVRFGLAPLNRISRGLAAIRSGKRERLEGAFPVEKRPGLNGRFALGDAVEAGAHEISGQQFPTGDACRRLDGRERS